MTCGIITLALGYELYGSCAYNLALSLKANDKKTPISLLHDKQSIAHLTRDELSLFDNLIEVDDKDWIINGVKCPFRFKLLLNKYTPYDYTVYMDADNIWIPDRKVSWLIGETINEPFSIGYNGEYDVKSQRSTGSNKYPYWGDAREICKYWSIDYLPQTVSGFMAFHKAESFKVFELALEAFNDKDAPGQQWVGGKSDEYCFNVAMGRVGMIQDKLKVFYFDRLDGEMRGEDIYKGYWGIATGGNKVSEKIVLLYNKLVNKYSVDMNMKTRHYHRNKIDVIPDRKKT